MDIMDNIVNYLTNYLEELGIVFGIMFIILESIIPLLPLGIFIAFNMIVFGNFIGFIISWISTIIGCSIAYYFSDKLFSKYLLNKTVTNSKLKRIVNIVKNIDMSNLVIIMALPLTPAFLINIASGITKMNYKKFLISTFISKISIVLFWGLVSKNIITNYKDIKTIIVTIILIVAAYIFSKLVNKKFKIE